MTAYCDRCRSPFETKADWHRLCWECWRKQRDNELRRDAYNDGYDAGMRRSRLYPAPTPLDTGTLRDLVQLCHPDRHPPERAALANQVTAHLLNLLNTRVRYSSPPRHDHH